MLGNAHNVSCLWYLIPHSCVFSVLAIVGTLAMLGALIVHTRPQAMEQRARAKELRAERAPVKKGIQLKAEALELREEAANLRGKVK